MFFSLKQLLCNVVIVFVFLNTNSEFYNVVSIFDVIFIIFISLGLFFHGPPYICTNPPCNILFGRRRTDPINILMKWILSIQISMHSKFAKIIFSNQEQSCFFNIKTPVNYTKIKIKIKYFKYILQKLFNGILIFSFSKTTIVLYVKHMKIAWPRILSQRL